MIGQRRQYGFILSMEALLLLTVLGVGLFIGTVAVRNALFRYYITQRDTRFIIADSSDPSVLIGEVVGYDEHESPLVVFVDYDDYPNNLPSNMNFRSLIGVRGDRFTTRQATFYGVAGCAGPAICIAAPGTEQAHVLIKEFANTTGTISYLNELQGNGPSYAVGRDIAASSTQDLLYRSTQNQCSTTLVSMWVSQTIATTNSDSCIDISSANLTGSNLASFLTAEAISIPGTSLNVLQGLTPPFYTNMIDNPLDDIVFIPPAAEDP